MKQNLKYIICCCLSVIGYSGLNAQCTDFADMVTIFSNNGCLGCHGAQGGLDLNDYSNVISGGNIGTGCANYPNPLDLLIAKVDGSTDVCGGAMPNGTSTGTAGMSTTDIACIQAWRDAGAPFWVEDFDGSNTTNAPTLAGGCGVGDNDDYFGILNETGLNVDYTGESGNFLGAQDTNGAGCNDGAGGSTVDADFTAIDISGCGAELYICVDLADGDASDGNEDWDTGDSVNFNVTVDGGASTEVISFQGPAGNSAPTADGDATSSCALNNTFTTYCAAISTGNSLDLNIAIALESGDEDVAIDNISLICGTANLPASSTDFASCGPVSCDLVLGTISNACDANTAGTDDYTVTIPFTGGNTDTYTITPNAGSVDGTSTDPDGNATGNIVISAIPEGTDLNFNITSTNGCDIPVQVTSPSCEPAAESCTTPSGTNVFYESDFTTDNGGWAGTGDWEYGTFVLNTTTENCNGGGPGTGGNPLTIPTPAIASGWATNLDGCYSINTLSTLCQTFDLSAIPCNASNIQLETGLYALSRWPFDDFIITIDGVEAVNYSDGPDELPDDTEFGWACVNNTITLDICPAPGLDLATQTYPTDLGANNVEICYSLDSDNIITRAGAYINYVAISYETTGTVPQLDWTPPVANLACDATLDLTTLLDAGTATDGVWSGTGVAGTTFDAATAGQGTQTIRYTGAADCDCLYFEAEITVDACTSITIETNPGIADPCACDRAENIDTDADTAVDIFYETVVITSDPGETWTLVGTTTAAGILDNTGNPAAIVTFTEAPAGTYTANFYHDEVVGYSATFTNGTAADDQSASNACTACAVAQCCTFGTAPSGTVVITELSFNPCGAQGSDGDCEYIELFNSSSSAVDISGWEVDGFSGIIPNGTSIPAGGYFVIAVGTSDCVDYDLSLVADLTTTGALSNGGGETLDILNECGNIVSTVTYTGTGGVGDGDCNAVGFDENGVESSVAPSPGTGCCTASTDAYATSCPTCSDIIIDAMATCEGSTMDNEYYIMVNSITGGDPANAGTMYTVSDGATNFTVDGSVATPIGPFTYAAATQNAGVVTLIVTDDDDNSCTTSYDVFPVNCLPMTQCDCAAATPLTVNVQGTGDANGYQMIYVIVENDGLNTIIASNETGTFAGLVDNTDFTAYAFHVADADVAAFNTALAGIATIAVGDASGILDNGTLAGSPFEGLCYDSGSVVLVDPCQCESCTIDTPVVAVTACDNAGTAATDADDTFSFTLNAAQSGDVSFTTYTFNGSALGLGSAESGTYGTQYSSGNLTIGALGGTSVTITLVDDTDPMCTETAIIDIPATCSSCPELTIEAYPVCSSTGGTYDIEYTITGGTGPYSISIDGAAATAGLAATGTLSGLTYAAQNTKVTLTISDDAITETDCSFDYDVLQLDCSQQVGDCICPAGTYDVNAQASGNGNGFSMVYVMTETTAGTIVGTSNNTGAFTGLMDGVLYTTYAFNVADDELAAFTADLDALTTITNGDASGILTDGTTGTFTDYCYVSSSNIYQVDCACNPPSIAVDKDDADNTDDTQTVITGGTATFTITVTNDGAEDLCNIVLVDALEASCNAGGPTSLAIGASATYNCTSTNVTADFINSIIVTATGCTSGTEVTDTDDTEVIVTPCPELTVVANSVCSATGTTFDIEITSITGGSGNYSVTDGTTTVASDGTILATITGVAYVDQNTKTTLTITDTDTGCTMMYDVLQLNCEAQYSVCTCPAATYDINAQASGNGNGFSMVYVITDATGAIIGTSNNSGTFAGLTGDGSTYTSYAFNVADDELTAFTTALDGLATINAGDAILQDGMSAPFDTFCYVSDDTTWMQTCVCDCPTVALVNGADNVCEGSLDNEIVDWQTAVTTDATNAATIADALTAAAVEYSSVEVDGTVVTAPDGMTGVDSRTVDDLCTSEDVLTYAYLLCFGLDGVQGGADDEYLLLGTHTMTVYPVASTPTITRDDATCAYTITPACGDDVLSPNTFGPANPGDDPAAFDVIVTTVGGCMTTFSIDPEECPSVVTCEDIVVDATTSCNGTTYDIVINSITGGTSPATYQVTIDGTDYTYPTDFPLMGQTYSGGDQATVTLLVTDLTIADGSCNTSFNVFELNCLAQEVCDCNNAPNSLTINAQAAGNANGFSMVYVLLDNVNGTITVNQNGTFAGLLGDNSLYDVFAFNVDDADLATFLTDMVDINSVDEATSNPVAGNFANYCYTFETVQFQEDCACDTCPTISAVLTGGASYCEVGTADIEVIFVNSDGTFAGTYDITYDVTDVNGTTSVTATGYNSGDAIIVTPTETTTYTLTGATITGDATCAITITGSAVVTVFDNPIIGFTAVDPTTCGGNDGSIIITGLTAGNTYNVFADDASLAGTLVADASGEIVLSITLGAGAYNNISVTDGNGCASNAISANLVDPGTPTVTIDPVADVCDIDAADVTLTAAPAGGVWTGNVDATGTFNSATLGAGTYTATYTVTESGCSASETVMFTIDDCGVFDLALTKVLTTAGPYSVGQTITYTIEVFNQGNVEATDIIVTDYLPAELNYTTAQTNWTYDAVNSEVVYNTIPSIPAGGSVQITIDVEIDASALTAGIVINNAEITEARDADGNIADDEDSTPGDNANTPAETGSDNDVNDESTGGTDNPSDSDDYDPAFFSIEEQVPTVDVVCNCDGSNATISAASTVGSFEMANTQIYVLVDDATGLVIQVSNNGVYTDVPTGTYSMYALNYDPADANVQTVLDNLVIGATFGLTVGTNEDPCYDLQVTPASVNQCIPDVADITNPALCADATTVDLADFTPAELNGVSGSGVWSVANTVVTVVNGDSFTYTFTSDEGCIDSEIIVFTVNPLPQIAAVTTDATCTQGGSITISIQGGISYTYEVGGNAPVAITASPVTNLNAGTYTITAIDSLTGCSNTETITIGTAGDIPTLDIAATDATCTADGTITINNPEAGITYTIDGVITTTATLAAGTYAVTASNVVTGCSATQNITINADATLPVITAIPTDPTCENLSGGTIVVTEEPGVTYTITGGSFTDLMAGSYTITATIDATGCSSTLPVTLNAPTDCGGDQVVSVLDVCPCNGDDATLIVSAENGTFNTDADHAQVYLLVQGGVIIASATDGTFAGLADGTYELYALNYEIANAPNFADGETIASILADATTCFDLSAPAIGTVNGTACGCGVDCTAFAAPSVDDINVCEGGDTEIFPTDNNGGAVAGVAFTALWDFEGEVTIGTSDNADITVADATVGAGVGATSFPGGFGGGDSYSTNNWPADEATALAEGDNFVFCVTAPATDGLVISELNFENDASGSGPQNYAIYLNGNSLIAGNTVADYASPATNVFAPQTVSAGATACFEIYGWGASSSGGTWRVDNVTIVGEVGATASNITFNYYDAETGGNLLASGFSYNPMTTAGTNQTIWVEATDGFCVSAAVPVTVSVDAQPNAGNDNSAFACDNNAEGNSTVDLATLLSTEADASGTWIDAADMAVANTTIDFAGMMAGTYTYEYVLAANGACEPDTAVISVNVASCNDCVGFAAPDAIDDIEICNDGNGITITPTGGGVSGNANAPFISEFHYNDISTDDGEGVEITGAAGALDCYGLYLYNGNGGAQYGEVLLTGVSIPDSGSGFGASFIDVSLQNDPDGIALVDICNNTVLEFISYGGVLEAADGPAAGMISVDVGVSESNSTPEGSSIQLTSAGWIADDTNSYNSINAGLLITQDVPVSGYTFADADGNIIASDVAEITVTETGAYTITAVGGACSSEPITVNVTLNDAPLVAIADTTICYDELAIFEFNAPAGDYNYLWTDAIGNIVGSNNSVYSPNVAGTYTLTVTDNVTGCSASDSATLTVFDEISLNVTPGVACAGETITLVAPNNFDTYLWTLNGAEFSTESSIEVTQENVSANGFGSFALTVTDINGCSASTNALAVFNQTPTVDAGEDVAICSNETITLTATSSDANATYLWNTGETTASITATPNGAATYEVTATSSFNIGGNIYTCSATDQVNVSIATPPSAGVDGAATVCNSAAEGDATIMLTSLLEGADAGGVFTNADGSLADTMFDADGMETGMYEFTYTVGGENGCAEDTAIFTITVEDCFVQMPAILIVKDDGDNQNDFQTIYSGGTATFTITVYNIGNEPLENIVVSDPLSPNCNTTYAFDPLMPGDLFSYECTIDNVTADFINVATVTATGTDSGEDVDDEDDTYVDVVLEPCPEIMIAGAGIATYDVCSGEELMLEVIVDNANEDNITWSTGDTGTMASITAMENNTCDVMTMMVTAAIPSGAAYCTDATEVTFSINVLPNPNTGIELISSDDACSVSLAACAGATISYQVNGQTFVGDTYTANAGESNEVSFFAENACGVSEAIVGTVDCAANVCDTPIVAEIITECSEEGSTYDLSIVISGGSGSYNVSGTYNETGVNAGFIVIGTYPDQTPYNFTISDVAGICPTLALVGTPEECAKGGCDDIILDVANTCDSAGENYQVVGSLVGGEAPYTITVNGETQTVDEGFSFGPYANLTSYNISIVDANDCELLYQGPTVQCEVTAIELLSFDGEVERDGNMLYWTTATEVENDYFTLERSLDGVNFEAISNTNAAGNSSTPTNYNFLDVDATNGANFYRLKATDYDGVTEVVSDIIKLVRGTNEATIAVRPVPTSTTLYIDYNASVSNDVFVTVYDVSGRIIDNVATTVNGGDNTIILDVEAYATGTYFLTLQDGEKVVNTKFIKK